MELLIVIVIIGILAAISIVAYNNISRNARNAGRLQELRQWDKQIQLYRVQYGSDPQPSAADLSRGERPYYCLGTGFPGDSCWSRSSPNIAYSSDTINAELAKVGSLPNATRMIVYGGLGPIVQYNTAQNKIIRIWTFFEGTDDCPGGTEFLWRDTTAYTCFIEL